MATGTDIGEMFLWSFSDYSFIQKLPGIINCCPLKCYKQIIFNHVTGHSGCVNKISFSRDCSKLISCSDDCCFKVFDAFSGLEVYTNNLQFPLK